MTDIKNFAHVDENNIVTIIITGESIEKVNEDFPTNGKWVETFPGVEGKIHPGIGDQYDEENDTFIQEVWMPDMQTIADWGYPAPYEHLKP